MKKTITFLTILMLGLACKQNRTEPIEHRRTYAAAATEPNISRKQIYALAKLLRDNESILCVNGRQEVSKDHVLTTDEHNAKLKAFWGTNGTIFNPSSVTYKDLKWEVIEKKLTYGCYTSYIGFQSDSTSLNNTDINIKVLDTFSYEEPCYSNAFFKEIQSKYGMKSDDIVKFSKAKDKNKYTIIVRIQKQSFATANYDITVWPKMVDNKNRTIYGIPF